MQNFNTNKQMESITISPEVQGEELNGTPENEQYPYGIVVHGKKSGLLIPETQLAKAGWRNGQPEIQKIEPQGWEEPETGLFLQNVRWVLLAKVPPYLRYKKGTSAEGEFIAFYKNQKYDRDSIEVASEHLFIFLDAENVPLHAVPIRIRFRNSALWNFLAEYRKFRFSAETAFSEFMGTKYRSKNQKWLSLCIFDFAIEGVKKGQESSKSAYCWNIASYERPQPNNIGDWFLGCDRYKEIRQFVWELQNIAEESLLPPKVETIKALPAQPVEGHLGPDEF